MDADLKHCTAKTNGVSVFKVMLGQSQLLAFLWRLLFITFTDEFSVHASAIEAAEISHTDVGIIQARGGLGFAMKSLHEFWIARKFFEENLDGNTAVQILLKCFEDGAHPASGELANQSVFSES